MLLVLGCLAFSQTGHAVTQFADSSDFSLETRLVGNVSAAYQVGSTTLVDVTYDLRAAASQVSILVSVDNGVTWTTRPLLAGQFGANVPAGLGQKITFDATGLSFFKVRVQADASYALGDFLSAIAAGTYEIGDRLDGIEDAVPVSVSVNPYRVLANDVTLQQWESVRSWAWSNGYGDLAMGTGRDWNHPVQSVSWYDVVKWANAASERAGLEPCYRLLDGSVYRVGQAEDVVCNWMAGGFRLPTEAEWEIAARGGVSTRFPWGDRISQTQANYYAAGGLNYDDSGVVGFHPEFALGLGVGGTSPVGRFGANGYGLKDVVGNVSQWCWDWYQPGYVAGSNPRGPATGDERVIRGGNFYNSAEFARVARRSSQDPELAHGGVGLRIVRGDAVVFGETAEAVLGASLTFQWDADSTGPGAQDGSGGWDSTTPRFLNNGSLVAWNSMATAVFGTGTLTTAGTAFFQVPVTGALQASGLKFDAVHPTNPTPYYWLSGVNGSLSLSMGAIEVNAPAAYVGVALVGSAGLTKMGSGNLLLVGTNNMTAWPAVVNTYAGPTRILQGTLQVTASGNVPSGSSIEIGSGANLTIAAGAGLTKAMGNSIFGPGSLTKVNTGTLRLDGFNSFQGGIKVSGGVLSLGPASLPAVGTLQVLTGTTVEFRGVDGLRQFPGLMVSSSGTLRVADVPGNTSSLTWQNGGVFGLSLVSVPGVARTFPLLGAVSGNFGALTFQLVGAPPPWVSVSGSSLLVNPPAGTALGIYSVSVRAVDVNMVERYVGSIQLELMPTPTLLGARSLVDGDTLNLSAQMVVKNPVGLSVTWYRNGVPLYSVGGPAGLSYSKLAAKGGADDGAYFAVISDGLSSVQTETAQVSFAAPASLNFNLSVASGAVKTLDFGQAVELANLSRPLQVTGLSAIPPFVQWTGSVVTASPVLLDPIPAPFVISATVADSAGAYARPVSVAISVTDGGLNGVRNQVLNLPDTRLIDVPAGNLLTLAGPVQGPGGLNKMGLGVLVLSASNSFLGPVNVGGGTLVMQGGNAGQGAWTVNAPGSVVVRAPQRINGLSGNGLVILEGGSLRVNVAQNGGFSGTLDGPGSIVKEGLGEWVLSGMNRNGGGTVVAEGTLRVMKPEALPPGPVIVAPGAVLLFEGLNGNITLPNSISGGGQIRSTNPDYTVTWNGGGTEQPVLAVNVQVMAGAVQSVDLGQLAELSQMVRPLSLVGLPPQLPPWVSVEGTKVSVAPSLFEMAPQTLNLFGEVVDSASTKARRKIALSVNLGAGPMKGTSSVPIFLDGPRDVLVAAGDVLTLAGSLQGPGGLNKLGTGQLVLSGTNGFQGPLAVREGLLVLGVGGAPRNVPVEVQAGAVVRVLGAPVLGGLGGSGTLEVPGASVTLAPMVETRFDGAIVGPGALVKMGPGGVTLGGASSYSGGTVVREGVLRLARTNALGAGGDLMVDGGALELLAGVSQSLAQLSMSNGRVDGGVLVAGGYSIQAGQVGASLSGGGALIKSGLGTLVLSGNNSYLGGTVVQGGEVRVRPGSLPAGSTVTMSADSRLVFDGVNAPLNVDVTINGGQVVVAGTGGFAVTWKNGSAGGSLPSIVKPPVGGTFEFGQPIRLSVEASVAGGATLNFQWKKNGQNLAGETRPELLIGKAQPGDTGRYSVVVSNPAMGAAGMRETNPVDVFVRVVPVLVVEPADALLPLGGSINSLNVGVGGVPPELVTFQWFKDGLPLPAATRPAYVKDGFIANDVGVYFAKVNVNVAGVTTTLETRKAEIRLGTPQVRMSPLSATVLPGENVVFRAITADQTVGGATFEWSFNGEPLKSSKLTNYSISANGDELTLSGVQSGNTGSYDVRVSAGSFGFASARGLLRVSSVSIRTQPLANVQLKEGDPLALSVEAEGAGGVLNYQWRRDGKPLTGLTASTQSLFLRAEEAGGSLGGIYDVVVSTSQGTGTISVVSQPSVVGVFVPVRIDQVRFGQQARRLDPGQRLVLESFASGSGPLVFQWLKDGAPVPAASGGTLATVAVGRVSPADAGVYAVRVTQSGVGGATVVESGTVAVVVSEPPKLPELQVLVKRAPVVPGPGGTVGVDLSSEVEMTLPLAAAGTTGMSFQWRRNGVPIVGERQTTLKVVANSRDQEGRYDVVASNTAGSATSVPVQLTLKQAPVVLESPLSDLTVVAGSSVAVRWTGFKVNAGGLPVTYKWTFNGIDLPNQGSDTLSLAGVSAKDAGQYSVTADNGLSNVSSTARLRVLVPVEVPTVNGKSVANPGEKLAYTAVLSNADSDTRYQWILDGQPVVGGTASAYSLAADSIADGGTHTVAVRVFNQDASGRVLSTNRSNGLPVRVRVPVSVSSLEPQQDQWIREGGEVHFAVKIAGDVEGLSYQWFKDGVAVKGGTASSFVANQAGAYSVEVKNQVNRVSSNSVAVRVIVPVQIVQQPIGRTLNTGKPVRLSVGAVGSGSLSYQWRKDGKEISGANASEYAFEMNTEAEGSYDVRVSGEVQGSKSEVWSLPAEIRLNDDVSINRFAADLAQVLEGGTTQLRVNVKASDGAKLRFQWRRNGVPIAGGLTFGRLESDQTLSSEWTIRAAKGSDAGEYDVLVSVGAVTVSSPALKVEVLGPIAVSVSPKGDTSVVPDASGKASVRLRATVSGGIGGELKYQWFRQGVEGVVLSDQAEWDAPVTDDLARYQVKVESVVSGLAPRQAMSEAVEYQLLAAASFAQHPGSAQVEAGRAVTLKAVAKGGGKLTMQWERRRSGQWTAITGATGDTLMLGSVKQSDEGNYRLVARNERGTATSEVATLLVNEAEVITRQPVSVTVNPTDTAVFSVEAKGVDLTYQWRKDGVAISGANSASLNVDSGTSREAVYDVVVTHAFGRSVSAPARLQENVAARIDLQPVDTALVAGKPLKLFVVASGTPTLSYQWQKNEENIPKATDSVYEIGSASELHAGAYRVLVSNVAGKVVSSSAQVSVIEPVTIEESPASALNVQPGDPVTFSVKAKGSGLKYVWRKNGVALVDGKNGVSGSASAVLRIESVDPGSETDAGSGGRYDVVVSNVANTQTSVPALLTVNAPPVILEQPKSQVVNKGDGARLSVKARGNGLSYQWYQNGNELAGATGANLVLKGLSEFGSTYYCVVSNSSGTVKTGVVTVTEFKGLKFASFAPAFGASENGLTVVAGNPARGVVNGGSIRIVAPSLDQDQFTLKYQWRKDGKAIAGATDSMLVLATDPLATPGVYDVIISAELDGAEKARIVSPASLVTVVGPPQVENLAAQSVKSGQSVLFAPVAAGSGTLTYRWSKVVGGVAVIQASHVEEATQLDPAMRVTVDEASGVLRLDQVRESAAGTYRLEVTDENGTTQREVALSVEPAITLTLKANGVAVSGGSVQVAPRGKTSLEVAARGDGAFGYQWRFNGVNIAGATRARFDVLSTLSTHEGRYEVVVSNATARVVSSSVTLKVQEPLRIVSQPPVEQLANLEYPLELSVGINDPDQGETYQWYRAPKSGGASVLAGTGRVLRIAKVSEADEGAYRVVVTAAGGKARVTSSVSNVRVRKPARVLEQPKAVTSVPGVSARFLVTATGDGPLKFQWFRDGVAVVGARQLETPLRDGVQSELQLPAVSTADAGKYQVVVSNPVSETGVSSDAVALSVSQPVTIVSEPRDNLTLKVGAQSNPVILSVSATGDGTLRYQWRFNGMPITGQTQSELRLSELTAFSSGQYDVVIRNEVTTAAGEKKEVSRVQSRLARVEVAGEAKVTSEVLEPAPMRVNEGATAVFRSFAAEGQTVSWQRFDGQLDLSRARGVDSASLSLRNVGLVDAGTYVATVTGGSQNLTVKWHLQVIGLPRITAQPIPLVGNLKRKIGNPATMGPSLEVSSDPETDRDTHFQWYYQKDAQSPWYAVGGATAVELKIDKVSARDVGNYRLEITNPVGTVSTDPAGLEVFAPVQVTIAAVEGELSGGSLALDQSGRRWLSGGTLTSSKALAAARGVPGKSLSLRAVTTGDLQNGGDQAFDWYYLKANRWTLIPNTRDGLLTLEGLGKEHETYYRVRALGVEGGVVSDAVRVALRESVAVEATAVRTVLIGEGDTATMTAKVYGTQPQYRWLRNGEPLMEFTDSGASLVSSGTVLGYSINKAVLADSGTYSVEVRNDFSGPVRAEVAVVSVKQAPGFRNATSSAPKAAGSAKDDSAGSVRVDEGQILELSAEPAEGCAPFTYQWRKNGVAIIGASGSFSTVPDKLTFSSGIGVKESDGGQYDVVLSNRWGTVTSSPVRVLVALKARIANQPQATTASEGGSANFTVETLGEAPVSYRWYKASAPQETLGTERLLSLRNVSAVAGGEYRVEVSNRLGSVVSAGAVLTVTKPGDFTVSVNALLGGVSVAAPLVVVPGKVLELKSSVTPTGTYTYQWRKDGLALPGATGANLSVGALGSQSGGAYEVVVSDGANFAYSPAVTVAVEPRVESFEVPSEANLGDGLLLQVKAVSSKAISYEWRRDGKVVGGETGDTLKISSAKVTDFGVYQVKVTSGAGEVLTEPKTLAQAGKVRIKTQPLAKTVEAGSVLSLSVEAENALTYQWYRTLLDGTRKAVSDGAGISGATSTGLTIASVATGDAGVYEVEVSGSGGSATSVPVVVTVLPKLSVSVTQPRVTASGEAVNLLATVVGSGTISYKWSFTPAKPAGSLARSLSESGERLKLASVQASDAGVYTVEVSNGNSTASASATLSVLSVPKIVVAPASQSVVAGGTTTFAVVASYDKELSYTWYFGTGESRQLLTSGSRTQAAKFRKSGIAAADAGIYTVVVADASNPEASVEVSAKLSVRDGTTSQSGDSSSSQAPSSFSKWWVYRVSGIPASGDGATRYGYWAVERIKTPVTGGGEVHSTGRSVWVWDAATVGGAITSKVWAQESQTVQEASSNSKGEFSVVATAAGEASATHSYVVSGLVEDGSYSALYGAPDALSGEYDVDGLWLELELTWENSAVGVYETLDALEMGLKQELDAAVVPAGD